jgi:hypothetical protein
MDEQVKTRSFSKLYKHFTITAKTDQGFFTTPHISIGWDKDGWRGISVALFAFDITVNYHYNDPDLIMEWEQQQNK